MVNIQGSEVSCLVDNGSPIKVVDEKNSDYLKLDPFLISVILVITVTLLKNLFLFLVNSLPGLSVKENSSE